MNDFTKGELQILAACIFRKWVESLNDPSIQFLTKSFKELEKKLQSLIDNYCEHDVTGDGAGLQQICWHCGKECLQ